MPIVVELSRMRSTARCDLVALDGREDALEVVDHRLLDVAGLEHLPEHEEDQEREGKQGQREVVGDHRRHSRDVLSIGPVPEGAKPVA